MTEPRAEGRGTGDMDYEDAARRLVTYSRAFAKGSFSTAYGLSVGEMPVLEYLSDHPEGTTPSTAAKALGFTRSRMTRILDSLVAKGFVSRQGDPADRRRVIAVVTDEGRTFARERREEGVSDLSSGLEALGEHDTKELLRVLEKAYSITYDRDSIVK